MIHVKIRCPHCYLKIACGNDFKGSKVSCPGCKREIRIPTPTYNLGTDVHGFVIEQWLGSGAMGEVHLARQLSMDRLVALKIMPEHKLQNDEDKHRFVREVKTLANLKHPNIVTAIQAGEFDGAAYLVMSYIDGMTVEDKIDQEGSISEKTALRYCETIADALDHAWKNCKLIHRDLKPANFMIDTDNNVHLMDMGVAKRADNDMELTAVGIVMGTPYYMSPEQARGNRDLDQRSDIYSLGASLYHMVSGHIPYGLEDSSTQVMSQKLVEPPESPRKFKPDISKAMCKLINRMMAKDPDKRPQTWQDVKSMIQIARKNYKSISGSIKKNTPAPRKTKGRSRNDATAFPVIAFSSAIVIVILTFLILIITR